MTKITVDRVTKTFVADGTAVQALDQISLDVESGEFLVIVGPSGCGKSTLLRIIAGLDIASSGSVTIARSDAAKPLNAMVFQGDSIFPWMRVDENVGYGLRCRGVGASERRNIVSYYVNKVGLAEFARAFPFQLSGGMRQRVSVARAFANDPEVLLMDEPFAALDEQTKLVLQAELQRIWGESQKTVVYVTHSIDEAILLGDRIVVMSRRPGRIMTVLPVELPRPRTVVGMRGMQTYHDLFAAIWKSLGGEVETIVG